VCHFVDLLQYLTRQARAGLAHSVGGDSGRRAPARQPEYSILFADGSVEFIYTALGSRAMPKERIEVFAGGRSFVMIISSRRLNTATRT